MDLSGNSWSQIFLIEVRSSQHSFPLFSRNNLPGSAVGEEYKWLNGFLKAFIMKVGNDSCYFQRIHFLLATRNQFSNG